MGYYSDYNRDLRVYFKDEIKLVDIIKIFVENGWKVHNDIKYIYREDKYYSRSYFNDDITENIVFDGNEDNFYRRIVEIFDEYGAIEIAFEPPCDQDIAENYKSFSFLKTEKHLEYFKWGEEHPINEYDYSTIYDFTMINNIMKFGVSPTLPEPLNPPYGKTGYWELYEGYIVPMLVEGGIEVEKVEFEHEIEDIYRYHKFKYYNKLDSGEWEITDDLRVDDFRIVESSGSLIIEVDGRKIESINDFLAEMYLKMGLKVNHTPKFRYNIYEAESDALSGLIGFLASERDYRKRLNHITWINLKYSKEKLGNDFYKILEVINVYRVVLDYTEEDGTLIRLNQPYFEKPIRKIGKKKDYEEAMKLEREGKGLEAQKRQEISFNLLELYGYDVGLYPINHEADFKIKINNKYKDFKNLTMFKKESVEVALNFLDKGFGVILEGYNSYYKEFINQFMEKEGYEEFLDNIIINNYLKLYTFNELKEFYKRYKTFYNFPPQIEST